MTRRLAAMSGGGSGGADEVADNGSLKDKEQAAEEKLEELKEREALLKLMQEARMPSSTPSRACSRRRTRPAA